MFRTKVVEKIKTHILCSGTFLFSENRAVCEIMWEKYDREGEATDEIVIRRMRIACRITKARMHTHSLNLSQLWFLHGSSGYANAPQCYFNK
jgi:hypothetical protein